MSGKHLLLISIGPVQDFIAQARRTRDLWFGSHLLSELSRACAAQLTRDEACLIFPALDKSDLDGELRECDGPTWPEGNVPPLSIANKILAELPEGVAPSDCAKAARAAVIDRWRRISGRVRACRHWVLARQDRVLAKKVDDVWHEQIDDILEFYAVWVPLGPDYTKDRNAAEQALAGRKNLRDFRPWMHDLPGMPKSSLDGARVSVLPRAKDRKHPDFRRFGIRSQEELDAVGLVKRTGFEPEKFIPLVNVAAGHWLQRAQLDSGQHLDDARKACATKKVSKVDPRLNVVKPFPFDASVLYPSRWSTLFSELPPPESVEDALKWGNAHIRPLLKHMKGEPSSYVACLVADGDYMGKAIDKLVDAEANRKFSRKLGDFPRQARTIVENNHCGALVYAGGDDVLAFLPVATALRCAKALAEAFHKALDGTIPPEVKTPTLSVGIGIGHVLDSMSMLLQLGKDAERAAKDSGRNALAVIVDKRAGGQRRFAQSWENDPMDRIQKDWALLDGRLLSTGKAHALEALLNRFPEPNAQGLDPTAETQPAAKEAASAAASAAAKALFGYANDLLRHTGEGNGKISLACLGVTAGDGDYKGLRTAIRTAIDRVLMVHTMMEAGFDGEKT